MGATLALGYPFVVANDLRQIGSRVWRPAIAWCTAGMVVGQLFIAAGWTGSYVEAPSVHGLAVLSILGVAFIVQLLGQKTAAQEASEARLREGEARFRAFFADNPQPMWVFDATTHAFIEVNDAAVEKYGYSHDEFLALGSGDIGPVGGAPREAASVTSANGGTRRAVSCTHRLKDGRTIDVELDSNELFIGDRVAVVVAIRDVTERNELEAALRHQAFHDPLTGLANRALLEDRIEHAIHRQRRTKQTAAVLVLDLDRFKTVNDSLGHTAGDQLLVGVAERLRTALRQADTPARIGGDEFAVLVEDLDTVDDATIIARRILAELSEPFRIQGLEVFVRASIGISLLDVDGATAEELLRNADSAMYRAKKDGNCFRMFESEMHRSAVWRLELEADLRRALAEKQLVLHYQPIVSLATQCVVGVEALVRWDHPTRGLVPPLEFIPLCEENGLIVELGRWVLREACVQTQLWRDTRNPALGVSVNVSRRQLRDPGFVDDAIGALRDSGLAPSALTLEITESALVEDEALVVDRLLAFKRLGVKIAIDDFGTGYSSLSSVHNWPVDTLKIDKSFIDGVTTRSAALGVVQAIVGLAQVLQLETVAEGVELGSQLDRLFELNCSHMQGYCFSRPLPPSQVADLLETNRSSAPPTGTMS